MRKLCLSALAISVFGAGIGTGVALSAAPGEATVKVTLDNADVTVNEILMAPGAQRPARTRPSNELVFFCEEAHYQAIDAQGKKESRDRVPGAVVFHKKGELAPTLVNTSKKPVRYYSVSLK
jgi:hypothetical protein